jgi:biopolymer transport protein ExbB
MIHFPQHDPAPIGPSSPLPGQSNMNLMRLPQLLFARMHAFARPNQVGAIGWACLLCTVAWWSTAPAWSQDVTPIDPSGQVVAADEIESIMTDEPVTQPVDDAPSGVDLLTLIWRGGAFMIPIGLMSLMVVALSVERALSLRRKKMMPDTLVAELNALASPIEKFNPAVAQKRCEEFPSPLARVVSAMLARTGQPLADAERAVSDAMNREADNQAATIRWLTLAAAATPLMGLLGTVWGMIMAFHESTTLTADRSRSEQLSEGIYTALVTTLAGLAVAIPAAILALYLENRLSKLIHQMEAFVLKLSPGLIRFTGREQLDQQGVMKPFEHDGIALPNANVNPGASSKAPASAKERKAAASASRPGGTSTAGAK